MFLSILTPAFNASDYLKDLIESVLSQSMPDYEHVVIDDGSNDAGKTQGILRQYGHLRWWSRENRGQYATQNELLEAARGEFVTFISADDLYAGQDALARIRRASEQGAPDVIYGQTWVWRMAPDGGFHFNPHIRGRLAFRLLRYCPTVQHCSLFARRDLLLSNRLFFDPSLKMRGDWDWLLRLAGVTRKIVSVGAPIAYWRHHGGQTSRRFAGRGREETLRVCHRHHINYTLLRAGCFALGISGLCLAGAACARKYGLARTLRRAVNRKSATAAA